MKRSAADYEDILEPRRREFSSYCWTARGVNPVVAYVQKSKPSPEDHQLAVLRNPFVQELLQKLAEEKNVAKEVLEKQVKDILEEIGYKKSLNLIRWLGTVLVKICLKVNSAIYINKASILHMKTKFGSCPVIFVPSHRSYADFILMSLVCFHYDVAIPAIAAGMDFQGMMGIGEMLRNTGAFFMRRSYSSDELYWTIFKEYVHQLVTRGDLPIEFFIEGTRSRSNKSLSPKFGLLTMILKSFFIGQVPDILFVPINISYQRILEEKLFAFELLGIPKPKESTSGFFKSLSILSERYGNIYFHFGDVISAKEFFGDGIRRSKYSMGPLHQKTLTEADKLLIPLLAYEIVHRQQQSCTLTAFNLIATVLNHNLVSSTKLMKLGELVSKVQWVNEILEEFGAFVDARNLEKDVLDALLIQKDLVTITRETEIKLVWDNIVLGKISPEKLKGHGLSSEVMTFSVPFVMLYLYINPLLHYLVNVGILVKVLHLGDCSYSELFTRYSALRKLLSHEFVIHPDRIPKEFEYAFEKSLKMNVLTFSAEETYKRGCNSKLIEVLDTLLQPFIYTYFVVTKVLLEVHSGYCEEKYVLATTQKYIEAEIISNYVHPYSLSLDTISNCLSICSSVGLIKKCRRSNKSAYEIQKRDELSQINHILEVYASTSNKGQTLASLHIAIKNKL